MNQGDEVYVLLLHWSAKETLFKVMGVEGVDFIRHLHIFPFVMEEEGCLEAQEYRTEEQWHYRVRYLTHPDFVLTWTIKKCQRDSHQADTQINLAEFILIKNLLPDHLFWDSETEKIADANHPLCSMFQALSSKASGCESV